MKPRRDLLKLFPSATIATSLASRSEAQPQSLRGGPARASGTLKILVPDPFHVKPLDRVAALETPAKRIVLGATLSDADPWLPPYSDMSFGMPNNWGAAAIVFALIEGLAGIKDTGSRSRPCASRPDGLRATRRHATSPFVTPRQAAMLRITTGLMKSCSV